MTDYSDSFNEHADALRLKREAQDRDDYNFAVSGVGVGRQRKHLQDGEIDPLTGEKKKDAIADALQRSLEELLLNPQYRIAHENLVSAVRDASSQADRMLDDIRIQLDEARDAINIMLSKAARLKDGRMVFKFADGRVEDENGNIIDDALTQHIIWTPDMPTGEEFRGLQDRINRLEDAEREVLGIQTEIGDINNRAHDNENPFTPDALQTQTDRVNDLRNQLEEIRTNVLETTSNKVQSELSLEDAELESATASGSKLPTIKIGG